MAQSRVERSEEVIGRIPRLLLLDSFVARRAGVAPFVTGELQHDPVRPLDESIARLVDLRSLVQRLPNLGEEPLRGNLAAVAGEPGLAPLAGDTVQFVGLGLTSVMLLDLDPGVGAVPPFRLHAQGNVRFVKQKGVAV